jgi:hypothetical protein
LYELATDVTHESASDESGPAIVNPDNPSDVNLFLRVVTAVAQLETLEKSAGL